MPSRQHEETGTDPATGTGPAGVTTMRVVGVAAIVLATSMVLQNAMFAWSDAPGYGDPLEDVLVWHAQNRTVVAIAVAQEALHVPLLLGFLAGLHGIISRRRKGAGSDFSRLALAAGATLSAVWSLYAVLWVGAVLPAADLTEASPVFELAWQLHAAAFALALPALGATFVGAAVAGWASRLTPPWQGLLGVVGGSLLLLAGAAGLAIADGSALLLVGLPGLAAWLLWLFATGARLVRARPAERTNAFLGAGATSPS